MENQSQNPLLKHFRQPAIYLRLPSNGQWWDEDALIMPANQELPVYPMSTKDEIMLRTPDALLNGQGIIDVIQSCCPNIRNAWKMPSVDLDAVLIAIRIATYGNHMDFDSKCTHCNEENTHGVELGQQLDSLRCPDYNGTLEYKNLKIKFKPQQYFAVNRANMLEFQEQRIINVLSDPDLDPEVRAKQLTDAMDKLYKLGINACTNSTEYIEAEDGLRVTDTTFINEFYSNAESSLIRQMQARISEFTQAAKPQPLDLQCQACTKPYKVDLTFDYASFFGNGS